MQVEYDGEMETSRRDRLAVLLLVVLVTLAFADLLFGGMALADRDLFVYHFPLKKVVRDLVQSHELPQWNPFVDAGQPLAANPAYELYYPPSWLTFLPDFVLGFKLHILVHYYIAAIGMYLLLRALRNEPAVAWAGAIAYGLGGPLISYAGLLPFLFSSAWAPWTAAFAIRYHQTRERRDFAIGAVALAMQIIIGEPVTLLVTVAALGIAAIAVRELRAAAFFVIVAAALSAAQLLPGIDHSFDSVRRIPLDPFNAREWSFPPARPVQLFFPAYSRGHWWYPTRGAGFLTSIYVGVLLPLLAIAGIVLRRSRWLFALAAILVSYVIALGDLTPLIQLIVMLHIRYAEKFVIALLFAVIVFGASMIQRVLDDDVALARVSSSVAVFCAIVAGIAAIVTSAHIVWMTASIRFALFALLLLAIASRRLGKKPAAFLIAVAVAADVLPASLPILLRVPDSFYEEAPAVPPIPPQYRLYPQAERGAHAYEKIPDLHVRTWIMRNNLSGVLPEAWHIATALGVDFDATTPMPATRVFGAVPVAQDPHSPSWPRAFPGMANAPYRTENIPLDLDALRTVTFVRDPIAAPRYSFARRLDHCDAIEDCVSLLDHWSEGVALSPGPSMSPSPGVVRTVHETARTADLDVTASGPACLIISITRHKYWTAAIDGRPASLYPVNFGFQALLVPAGAHHIRLEHRNPLLVPSISIDLLTLVALAV